MIFENFTEFFDVAESEALAATVTHNADDLGMTAVSGDEHGDIGR